MEDPVLPDKTRVRKERMRCAFTRRCETSTPRQAPRTPCVTSGRLAHEQRRP